MHAPLTSEQWYRVADLHPRLRGHVRVQRQVYRHEIWYLLLDQLRHSTHRLNPSAYAFLGRCDGRRSVGQVWKSLLELAPDTVPSQDEIIDLLSQLNRRGLVQCEQTPDVERLFRSEARGRHQDRLQAMNPMSFRVVLFDPDNLLARLAPLAGRLFNLPALLAWALLVAAGLLAGAANWPALSAHAATWLATPRGIFLTWLAFPLIKAIHETAHALAVRRWGGEVHAAGISLLVLTPVPFVDASAASAFRATHQRFVVSAAGVMAEMAMAALAVLLWTVLQPGPARDLALIVATIGSVSTLLFNGNPLLRFDGYHMLTDALHLPNLNSRSHLFWRYLFLRHALRRGATRRPAMAPGERPWLVAYAPLAWLYRAALSLLIVRWVGGWSPAFALLVGIGALWALFGAPARGLWRSLGHGPHAIAGERPTQLALAAWLLGLVALLGIVPMPFSTLARGVVWVPEKAQIRAESGGFISAFKVPDGAELAVGDTVAILADPVLQAEAERLKSEIVQQETELYRLLLVDPVGAANLRQHIERLTADLARVGERLAGLEIRAGVAGRLALPHQQDILGSYVGRGSMLGHIVTGDPATVRVAVAQEAAALVQSGTRSISLRLADAPWHAVAASLKEVVPGASERLPSAALADHAGGPYDTDPGDREHLKSREPLFLLDLALPLAQGERIGGRAWVRFEHAPTPLAAQWGRRLQTMFLRSFDPAG